MCGWVALLRGFSPEDLQACGTEDPQPLRIKPPRLQRQGGRRPHYGVLGKQPFDVGKR